MDKNGCATLKRLALIDFGVSSLIKHSLNEKYITPVKNNGYSEYYMAPEQNKGECYSYLTDVYGFGSTMADIFFGIKIESG